MATANDNYDIVKDDNLETFGLIWLDSDVNNSEENQHAQQEIRLSINHIIPFEEPDSCEKHIRSVSSHDRLVLIVSGRLGEFIVPCIHEIRQVTSIYVYCMDKAKHDAWAKHFNKVIFSSLVPPYIMYIYFKTR